jgi:peroxiredoxin
MEKLYSATNRFYQTLLPVIIVALAFQATLTTIHNRKLKKEIESKWVRPQQSIQLAPPETLKTGDKVESFTALDLAGVEHTVAQTGSKKTLLLAFTTTCPACKANAPNWVDLYKKIDKQQWNVLGLTLDDPEKTKAYVVEKGFEFPVLAMKEKKDILKLLKVQRIPTTLAIDENQKVVKVWVGGLQAQLAQVEKDLGIAK